MNEGNCSRIQTGSEVSSAADLEHDSGREDDDRENDELDKNMETMSKYLVKDLNL